MPRLYLVRHGRAAAGFADHADPGLDAVGQQQARDAAARLHALGPMRLVSSPLARARETALPLQERWQREIEVEPRVAEIPSDLGDLAGRAAWLGSIMGRRWSELDAPLQRWARGVVTCLLEQPADAVICSHFIAINVAVGWATGDDRVVHFRPDNASVSIIDTDGWHLRLVQAGAEADPQAGTKVN
jgi:broad specificity phosphatase PhoE